MSIGMSDSSHLNGTLDHETNSSTPGLEKPADLTSKHITRFFAQYMKNDSLGRHATAHFARQFGQQFGQGRNMAEHPVFDKWQAYMEIKLTTSAFIKP